MRFATKACVRSCGRSHGTDGGPLVPGADEDPGGGGHPRQARQHLSELPAVYDRFRAYQYRTLAGMVSDACHHAGRSRPGGTTA